MARTMERGRTARAVEDSLTPEELDEVTRTLLADADRLRAELVAAARELHGIMVNAGEGAGNDQADVSSATFERDHELTLVNNARHLLLQTERALGRIADGSYGTCESCSGPVGTNRLLAFPRATLCLTCKQREERR